MAEPRIAGLELGGTKCLALLAEGRRIVDRVRVPTTRPAETLDALDAALDGWWAEAPFAGLGIASFGPLGLDRARGDYGRITTTPKPGWQDTDLAARYAARFAVPVALDTDVTAAALAEWLWGEGAGADSLVYLTVGTGIGGGAVVGGRRLQGLLHPEMGHVRVRRVAGDGFAGICPVHGDCLEGLASGPAIAARAGAPGDGVEADHPVWRRVAAELGELVATLLLTLSPRRISFGGGVVIGRPALLPAIRRAALESLGGYLAAVDEAAIGGIVVPASFGEDAGPLGAIALGLEACQAGVKGSSAS